MIATALSILATVMAFSAGDKSNAELLADSLKLNPSILLEHLSSSSASLSDKYFASGTKGDGPMVRRNGSRDSLEALVGKGIGAVPYLLSKLESQNPSLLELGGTFVAAIPFKNHDPRYRKGPVDPWPLVEEDDVSNAANAKTKYRVREGDIALFALGQIVNRWYGILRCYPGATFYSYHSDDKSFVQEVRNEWKALSLAQFEQVILTDIFHPDSYARQSLALAKYRSMFPSKSENIAEKCILNAYGSFPKGRPSGRFPTIFQQIQPIACERLDKVCYKLLLDEKKRSRFGPDYRFTELDILGYLVLRPGYKEKAIDYANAAIAKKGSLASHFSKFLQMQGEIPREPELHAHDGEPLGGQGLISVTLVPTSASNKSP